MVYDPGLRPRKTPHLYLFRASWAGTGLAFKIEGRNEEQAWQRARRYVHKMQGAATCLDLDLIRQIH